MDWKEFLRPNKEKILLTVIIFSINLITSLIYDFNCSYVCQLGERCKPELCDYLWFPSFIIWISFSISQDILNLPIGYPRSILTIIISFIIIYIIFCLLIWIWNKLKKKKFRFLFLLILIVSIISMFVQGYLEEVRHTERTTYNGIKVLESKCYGEKAELKLENLIGDLNTSDIVILGSNRVYWRENFIYGWGEGSVIIDCLGTGQRTCSYEFIPPAGRKTSIDILCREPSYFDKLRWSDNCKDLETQYEKDECYKWTEKCNILDTQGEINECYKCARSKKPDDMLCYWKFGIKLEDTSLCNKITESEAYFKLRCIAAATWDSSVCEQIDGVYRTSEGIEEHYYRGLCYFDVGQKSKDSSICAKIEDDFWREACISELHN